MRNREVQLCGQHDLQTLALPRPSDHALSAGPQAFSSALFPCLLGWTRPLVFLSRRQDWLDYLSWPRLSPNSAHATPLLSIPARVSTLAGQRAQPDQVALSDPQQRRSPQSPEAGEAGLPFRDSRSLRMLLRLWSSVSG